MPESNLRNSGASKEDEAGIKVEASLTFQDFILVIWFLPQTKRTASQLKILAT
jgi:hypothetical protein